MKKYVFIVAILGFQTVEAQKIGDLIRKSTTFAEQYKPGLSTEEIANGLKEALQKGAQTGTQKLSTPDGFLQNAALKIITTYNSVPLIGKKMNPDLVAYVTDKSLSGIYTEIASQEKDIRANPAARTTDLLRKVFEKK